MTGWNKEALRGQWEKNIFQENSFPQFCETELTVIINVLYIIGFCHNLVCKGGRSFVSVSSKQQHNIVCFMSGEESGTSTMSCYVIRFRIIHVPQKMNHSELCDSLTVPLAPLTGRHFWSLLQQNYWIEGH